MISHKYKFIFVHVPKTGGTSIMTALRSFDLRGEGHYTLDEIKKNNNISSFQAQQYYKFAVIRNPWDIVVSNYHYSRMKKSFWHSDENTTRYELHPDYELSSRINFSEYVKLLVENKLNHHFSMVPQVHWIDETLNSLIRFENLENDFSKVCRQIGLGDVALEKINPSRHQHYSEYYDNLSRDLIYDYFLQDIKQFNYTFIRK